jgi:hypothetical protein
MLGDLPTSGWRFWAVCAAIVAIGVLGLLFYETLQFK